METNLLLARRSIYDNKMKVIGYQLLFDNPQAKEGSFSKIPEDLNIEYLAALFYQDDMRWVLGDGMVLVNFSESMLAEDIPTTLPKQRILIGIHPKYVQFNADNLSFVKQIRGLGYKVLLNYYDGVPSIDSFTSAVDIIGLDTNLFSSEDLAAQVNKFSKTGVQLLAQNIQTHEAFTLCNKFGFKYYDGYFLSLPNVEKKQKVSSNRLTTMRLLVALDDPDITLNKVEELLSQDSRLSYRLLRAVNSAAYGLPREVKSLREAVVMLGLKQIRSWASIIVLTSLDDKPTDLMLTTMIRARMCELVGDYLGVEETKTFFTAGLFSTLDAMLDRPMSELVEELKLAGDLKEALLNRSGDIGAVLQNVIAYDRSEWEELKDSGLGLDVWRNMYVESVSWATTSFNEMRK